MNSHTIDGRKSLMDYIVALLCVITLTGYSPILFTECPVPPASVVQQSPVTPETREAFETVVLVGSLVCHDIWVSFLKSHRVIREFEEKGGKCRHLSEGLFTPDFSFSNDWEIECIVPPFRGNEEDLEKIVKALDISKIVVRSNVEHSLQGSFLVALNGDPIHSMDLENVVLDQKSTQVLVESCENLIELRLQCPSLNDLQLVEFNRCRRLESVTIRSGNITDSSLSAVLVRAKQLSFIELEGRGIDGSFLSKMEGDLSWLRLDNCDITDEGMKGLRHVPRVEILSIKHSGM